MLPRPSCIPIPKPCKTTKTQHNVKSKPTAQKVRLSRHTSSQHQLAKISHSSHSTTRPTNNYQPSKTNRGYYQTTQTTHDHPEPTLVRQSPQKSTLLPTPPASERISNTYNYKQDLTRPSTINSSKSTFARPAEFNNHRFHQQYHIPRPHTTRFNNQQPPLLPSPSCQHQNFITRLYQQPQGHCTQQLYIPIVILTPYNQLNNVLAHQTNLFNPHQY